jgi:hypothetical protein
MMITVVTLSSVRSSEGHPNFWGGVGVAISPQTVSLLLTYTFLGLF